MIICPITVATAAPIMPQRQTKMKMGSRRIFTTAPASVVADARPAEGPKLIQTGQLNWPIPVLTASGLVLVAVGAYLMERSKKREKNA